MFWEPGTNLAEYAQMYLYEPRRDPRGRSDGRR